MNAIINIRIWIRPYMEPVHANGKEKQTWLVLLSFSFRWRFPPSFVIIGTSNTFWERTLYHQQHHGPTTHGLSTEAFLWSNDRHRHLIMRILMRTCRCRYNVIQFWLHNHVSSVTKEQFCLFRFCLAGVPARDISPKRDTTDGEQRSWKFEFYMT